MTASVTTGVNLAFFFVRKLLAVQVTRGEKTNGRNHITPFQITRLAVDVVVPAADDIANWIDDFPFEAARVVAKSFDVRGFDFEVFGGEVVSGSIPDRFIGNFVFDLVARNGDVAVNGDTFAGHLVVPIGSEQ